MVVNKSVSMATRKVLVTAVEVSILNQTKNNVQVFFIVFFLWLRQTDPLYKTERLQWQNTSINLTSHVFVTEYNKNFTCMKVQTKLTPRFSNALTANKRSKVPLGDPAPSRIQVVLALTVEKGLFVNNYIIE